MRQKGIDPKTGRQRGVGRTLPGGIIHVCSQQTPSALFVGLGLLGSIVMLIACGGAARMDPSASGTNNPRLQLAVNPASLSFGNVPVGGNTALPVVVTNAGDASVTISGAAVTGAGFSASGPALPLTLAAGQNTSLSVTFYPTTGGSITGSLSVASNATNSPNVVSLSGTGASQHSVTLAWAASTSSSIAGYNVYRGMISGGPYAKLNASLVTATSYSDATVEAGKTYYYVTTALNAQGVESSDSNQAEAVIPSP